jgi:hypothetical protein
MPERGLLSNGLSLLWIELGQTETVYNSLKWKIVKCLV